MTAQNNNILVSDREDIPTYLAQIAARVLVTLPRFDAVALANSFLSDEDHAEIARFERRFPAMMQRVTSYEIAYQHSANSVVRVGIHSGKAMLLPSNLWSGARGNGMVPPHPSHIGIYEEQIAILRKIVTANRDAAILRTAAHEILQDCNTANQVHAVWPGLLVHATNVTVDKSKGYVRARQSAASDSRAARLRALGTRTATLGPDLRSTRDKWQRAFPSLDMLLTKARMLPAKREDNGPLMQGVDVRRMYITKADGSIAESGNFLSSGML